MRRQPIESIPGPHSSANLISRTPASAWIAARCRVSDRVSDGFELLQLFLELIFLRQLVQLAPVRAVFQSVLELLLVATVEFVTGGIVVQHVVHGVPVLPQLDLRILVVLALTTLGFQ